LADIFEDCKDIFESDKPQFLTLLENHIDLDEFIPFFLQSSLCSHRQKSQISIAIARMILTSICRKGLESKLSLQNRYACTFSKKQRLRLK